MSTIWFRKHDWKGMWSAAPLDDNGRIRDHSNMETQMRQTYANAQKILSQFGARPIPYKPISMETLRAIPLTTPIAGKRSV